MKKYRIILSAIVESDTEDHLKKKIEKLCNLLRQTTDFNEAKVISEVYCSEYWELK